MQPVETSLTDSEIAELDELLASFQGNGQPMDVSALDGYLCGVLLQPVTISEEEWLPLIFDLEGRASGSGAAAQRVASLARRRLAELKGLVAARQWFDPWIFEPDEDGAPVTLAQLPWVAGFAAAMERFPGLMRLEHPSLLDPLAVLYAVFDPDDLEDADDLQAIIETLEPPQTMAEAAEDLVRSVLLLADVTRPRAAAARSPQRRLDAKKRRKPPSSRDSRRRS